MVSERKGTLKNKADKIKQKIIPHLLTELKVYEDRDNAAYGLAMDYQPLICKGYEGIMRRILWHKTRP
jgi:hypothetical protein